MIPQHTILKKRNGQELAPDELRAFLNGYIEGHVAEYQMAAFLMAVFFRGMSAAELAALVDDPAHHQVGRRRGQQAGAADRAGLADDQLVRGGHDRVERRQALGVDIGVG